MNKSNPNQSENQTVQLSLFTPQLDNRIRRVVIDGETYFSILDTFEYGGSVGSKSNPTSYWQRAQKRLVEQGGSEVLAGVLQHQFPGQGQRKTPIAPFKFFLRLVQVVEIAEWEPIRVWMADVAHERIEEEARPGLGTARAYARDLERLERAGYSNHDAAEHLRSRIAGIDTFKSLSAEIVARCDKPNIGKIINTEYLGLFGATADTLHTILYTKHIRDALPTMQLRALEFAESALKEVLKRADKLTTEEICNVAQTICYPLGEQLASICRQLGIHAVTGRPLIGE